MYPKFLEWASENYGILKWYLFTTQSFMLLSNYCATFRNTSCNPGWMNIYGNVYYDLRKAIGVVPDPALLFGKVAGKWETVIYFTLSHARAMQVILYFLTMTFNYMRILSLALLQKLTSIHTYAGPGLINLGLTILLFSGEYELFFPIARLFKSCVSCCS